MTAAALGLRMYAVSNFALKSDGMISMQYFSHCIGTCEEDENDVQSKMISNDRTSTTEGDVRV